MIIIKYLVPEKGWFEKQFKSTGKGQNQSVKFLQDLHSERKKHPWYYELKNIEAIKAKLDDRNLGRRTKKRFELETQLRIKENDRNELLELLGITGPPPLIKVDISHK